MKLYLLRHADAATLAVIDDERAISAKGVKQSRRVAKFCCRQEIKPAIILASPLLRAQQTAKPVADKLGIKIETAPWLVYGTGPERVIDQLAARSDIPSIMLVGHEPDLGLLAAALLGSGDEAIHVRKASLILLEVTDFRMRGARLEWAVPVKLM
jgi:phosphohistidine phosphatase